MTASSISICRQSAASASSITASVSTTATTTHSTRRFRRTRSQGAERGWGVLLGSKHSSTRASRALSRTTTDFTRVHSFSMKTTTQCPRSTEVFIRKLIEHFILVFLDEDCPKAEVIDLGQRHNINAIFEKDYKASASSHSFKIDTYLFTLHGFELPTSRATKHKLIYAADHALY